MIVADYDRIRKGMPLIEPDRSLSHAGNFLLMLNGELPSETRLAPSTLPSSCTPTTSGTPRPSPRA